MNNYKSLISSYAVTLAVKGKKENRSCFDSLSKSVQKELITAYVAKCSEYELKELSASAEQAAELNPTYLISVGKLSAQAVLNIRREFEEMVIYCIENDLSEAFISAHSDKKTHIAEYLADWECAA